MQTLSLCISIYNYSVADMVTQLLKIALSTEVEFEMILVDDCSKPEIKEKNRKEVPNDEHIRWIFLEKNIGWSAVRMLMGKEAKYDWLLFMDCDVSIENEKYLSNYISHFHQADVVVGGFQYPSQAPEADGLLRWTYGRAREVRPAEIRNKHPYESFSSFNFCIKKELLERCPFKAFNEYGHEDTLLGLELKHCHATVLHIDNPIVHHKHESRSYLHNSKRASEKFIYSPLFQEKEKIASIRILRTYHRIKQLRIRWILSFIYLTFGPCMEKQLLGTKPSMFLFDVYRLSYLCYYARKK